MKKLKLFLPLFVAMIFSSCAHVYNFVQVFEATPTDSSIRTEGRGMLYEDNDCAIFYSFWTEGGDASFAFYNKTDQIIYIDLSKSFFIRNGIANDYYKKRAWSETQGKSASLSVTHSTSAYENREQSFLYGASATYPGNFGSLPLTTKDPLFTSASTSVGKSASRGTLSSASVTNTVATSKSSSTAVTEQRIIAIPPKSSKIIAEYSINNILLLDCDLQRYPGEQASLSFDMENSPLVFENYISYRKGNSEQDNIVENQFYISKVTNYAKPFMCDYIERNKPCQNKTDDDSKKYKTKYPVKVFDRVISIRTNNCFYLKYEKRSNRKLYKASSNYYYNKEYDGFTRRVILNQTRK